MKNQKISESKRQSMFELWCKNQNLSLTAKESKVSRTTIYRTFHRENWQSRYDAIQADLQKTVDKRASQSIRSNLEYVTSMKKKLLLAFLGKKRITASVGDLIKLMEYEDKLLGNLPGENIQGSQIVNIINNTASTEQIRTELSNGLVALASANSDENKKRF